MIFELLSIIFAKTNKILNFLRMISIKMDGCVCLVIDHEFRHKIVKVAVDQRGDSQ